MTLIELPAGWQGESALFVEGAILAANFATKPTDPELWLETLQGPNAELKDAVTERIHSQYALLKANSFDLSEIASKRDKLADFSEGFMVVWPLIEEQWQDKPMSDGTLRMLQALLTTFMLAIDEEQTHVQMKEAGYESLPRLKDLLPQLNTMISEVAMAADELMVGHQSQSVNPYKEIGRNDPCPCGSGKKFKQCCAK
ncbi:YecA family protein [Vibrio sp. ZSDZ34]|uniref:YecA family protein n=1 Tax=Vibrio gelatinilyticus TaxID=2893468 RepID=A0A9X1WDQ1_9VIBR|nr:YecA family protein [Vibrio gelatinilyticus]MCJ2377273.1 YecA family protein [Vibrio gelatinilyticus]